MPATAGPSSSSRIVLRDGEAPAGAGARVLEAAAHDDACRRCCRGCPGRGPGALGRIEARLELRPSAPTGRICVPGTAIRPFDPDAGAAPCDDLFVLLRKDTGRAPDMTLFWPGQDFVLIPVWPGRGASSRLP